jgi:hypothetical protein
LAGNLATFRVRTGLRVFELEFDLDRVVATVRGFGFTLFAAQREPLRKTPGESSCLPRTHTRRRADRSFNLATFHAGLDVTRSVRRNTSRISEVD